MKKLLLASVLMISVVTTATAGNLKIGVVNVQKILTNSPQVEAVNTKMLEEFGPKRDDLKKLGKEIQALQKNYKRNELILTTDKLNNIKKKIITKIQILKQKEAILSQQVNNVRDQELAKLQKSVRKIITKIAKKGKYSLILSEGVVYSSPKLDITNKVLAQMKAKFKKKK